MKKALVVRVLNMGLNTPSMTIVELRDPHPTRSELLHAVCRKWKNCCPGDVIQLQEGHFLILATSKGVGFRPLHPKEFEDYLAMTPLLRLQWSLKQSPTTLEGGQPA